MKEEIKIQTGEWLISKIIVECYDAGKVNEDINTIVGDLQEELLKRLSKNNIEEYKKKVLDEIKKLDPCAYCGDCNVDIKKYIINLINNIGKE